MNGYKVDPAKRLPTIFSDLLAQDLPPLGPGTPQTAFALRLENADSTLCHEWENPDSPATACCMAGLWLWNGFLDRSHQISQEINTPEGSWWHGIMHRREPDPGNAAYWFRRVGNHPLFKSLAHSMQQLTAGRSLPKSAGWLATADHWDPFRFIDLCESTRRSTDINLQTCVREAAAVEWYELFDYCRQLAAKKPTSS